VLRCDYKCRANPAKRKQASRSPKLARAPEAAGFRERLDCVKLASAFESERLPTVLIAPLASGAFDPGFGFR